MAEAAGLKALLEEEAACKSRATCARLAIRELFFEPNDGTMKTWREKYGFYKAGIDRRLVFVAESPSDRRDRADKADFEVGGHKGWRCWDYTWQDARFREVRVKHGFEHCLITNAVKCGVPFPSTPAKLTEDEKSACSNFLAREIEAIKPAVVACMGGSAMQILQRYALPKLSYSPFVAQLTHYSSRDGAEKLAAKWDAEFGLIKQALAARGIPDSPQLLEL